MSAGAEPAGLPASPGPRGAGPGAAHPALSPAVQHRFRYAQRPRVSPAAMAWGVAWNVLAWGLALAFLAPFVHVLIASLRPEGETWAFHASWDNLGFEQYHKVLGWGMSTTAAGGPGTIYRPLMNSLLVAGSLALGSIGICAGAGYAFACLPFRGKRWLWALTLASLAVPLQVLLVPLFHLVSGMGLGDSLWGAILPLAVSAMGVFLMRQAALRMPRELLEAARLDGAGEWQIFRHVVFPLLRPAMAALAIVAFLQGWNEFIWSRTILFRSHGEFTVPVYMAAQTGTVQTDDGLLLAAAVVSYLPVLVLFWAFQREFVSGLTAGAAKE